MYDDHSKQRTLVADANCRIDLCGCGTFCAAIGPVTVRLDRGSAQRLANCLQRAIDMASEGEGVEPTLRQLTRENRIN